MANLLIRVLLALGLLVLGVILVGLFLPRGYSTQSTITIAAPTEAVFAEVRDLQAWPGWSPWSPQRITGLEVDYEETAVGEDTRMIWRDPRPDQRFDGSLDITSVQKPVRIEYHAQIGGIPMDGFFDLVATGDQTEVTWTAAGQLPKGFAYGWFAMTYNSMLGQELGNSLQRLKQKIESSPTAKTGTAPANKVEDETKFPVPTP